MWEATLSLPTIPSFRNKPFMALFAYEAWSHLSKEVVGKLFFRLIFIQIY